MDQNTATATAQALAREAAALAGNAQSFADQLAHGGAAAAGSGNFVSFLTIFVLAVFVGYHVVWRVTPALHSPLMSVTNAISSVIIVGAMLATLSTGTSGLTLSKVLGFCAVTLAAVNIFGGFIVTQRMLAMFRKKRK